MMNLLRRGARWLGLLLLIWAAVCLVGRQSSAFALEEEEPEQDAEEVWRQETEEAINEVVDSADFTEWQKAADEAELEINVVQMIRTLVSGETELSAENLRNAASQMILGEARSMADWLPLFIGPALLWALNRSFLSGGHLGEAAGFVCFLAGSGLMLGAFSGWMEEARGAVRQLNRMTGQIFPTLMALVNSAGGSGTTGVMQTLISFLSGGMTQLAERIMTVLGGSAAALAVAGNMTERVPLTGLQKLCCTVGGWLMGGIMTAFLGMASLGGLLASTQDGMTIRAAKYAVDNLLPVVGGGIADTVDAMAFSAHMVKNAAGVTGMIIVAAACVRPVLRLALGVLVCRLAAALTEPVADGPLRRCMAQLGQATQLLLISVAVCAALFMTLLGVALSAGKTMLG